MVHLSKSSLAVSSFSRSIIFIPCINIFENLLSKLLAIIPLPAVERTSSDILHSVLKFSQPFDDDLLEFLARC